MENLKEKIWSSLKNMPVMAWLILLSLASIIFGSRLDARNRTYPSSNATMSSNWGGRMVQQSPKMDAKINYTGNAKVIYDEFEEKVVARNVRIDKSKVTVNLKMDSRRKGMVYYPTFVTDFTGEYEVSNESSKEVKANINFPLPDENNLVWDVALTSDGKSEGADIKTGNANWSGVMKAGEKRKIAVKYMARGQQDFAYSLAKSQGLQDFELIVNVDGAEQIDFPQGSLSPVNSQVDKENKKWNLVWKFDKVLTSPEITVRTFAKQNISSTLSKLFYFAPLVMWMLAAVIIGLGIYFKKGVAGWDLWLVTTLYATFYPLLAYIASVFEGLNLYQGLAISGGVVSVIMMVLYQFWWGWQNTFKFGILTQLMFVFFFPVAILIPELTGLLSIMGVIAILTAMVMMRVRKTRGQKDTDGIVGGSRV